MKYLKTYEEQVTGDVFWIIYGNFEQVNKVLDKFGIYFLSFNIKYHDGKDIIATYLGRDDSNGFDHFTVFNKDEFKKGKDVYEEENYLFQGEMKLVKDENGEEKIVVDPFEADIDKYNL